MSGALTRPRLATHRKLEVLMDSKSRSLSERQCSNLISSLTGLTIH